MAGAPSRCCHDRFKPRAAPYSPQSQTASGTTTANARYSSSSTLRRPIGETVVVSRIEPRHSPTAPSINDTAATWAVHCGYAAAAATRTVLTVAIPQMMSGTDLARSRCARARNSRTPPATVANRRPGNRGPPVRNGPRAAPIAPNAAEAEKAAIKLVSQAWARIALAFRRCGLENGTSACGFRHRWGQSRKHDRQRCGCFDKRQRYGRERCADSLQWDRGDRGYHGRCRAGRRQTLLTR